MSGLEWRRRLPLSLIALMLLFGVTACVPEDVKFAQDFANDWATSKNINPTLPNGRPNAAAIANILKILAVGSNDPVVDAALEAGQVVKSQQDADALAKDGLANGDIKKLNEAISMRPNDLTYVNDRGFVEMTNSAPALAQQDFAAADALAATQGKNAQVLNLRNRIAGLKQPYGNASDATLVLLHSRLCGDSQALFKITGNSNDQPTPNC